VYGYYNAAITDVFAVLRGPNQNQIRHDQEFATVAGRALVARPEEGNSLCYDCLYRLTHAGIEINQPSNEQGRTTSRKLRTLQRVTAATNNYMTFSRWPFYAYALSIVEIAPEEFEPLGWDMQATAFNSCRTREPRERAEDPLSP
jgi:hypothetical protein